MTEEEKKDKQIRDEQIKKHGSLMYYIQNLLRKETKK